VTFKDIDEVHGRPDGTAKRSFQKNRKHFVDGVDYFKICGDEIRTHKDFGFSTKARQAMLITETGYLMIVKSFTDDLSWTVQRELVNSYFRAKEMSESTYQIADMKYKTSNTLLPKTKRWCDRNGMILEFLRQAYKVPMETIYDWILIRLKAEYDLDAAIKIYEQERGCQPKRIADVVDYFPELSELATEYINTVAEQTRKKKG
jgi:hypothetical protein